MNNSKLRYQVSLNPGLEDYGIFLTQNGKKIQLDKDLLEKVEP
jgi:hypothetical protein